MGSTLSIAHHHVAQFVTAGDWRELVIGGQRLFVPPFTGRAIVGVQLLGYTDPKGRPVDTFRIRLQRHLPGGDLDDTGWHDLAIRREWSVVYAWTGYVTPDVPLALELEHDGARPIRVWNAALKVDRLSDGGEA